MAALSTLDSLPAPRTWTNLATNAPFWEAAHTIEAIKARGMLAVEMEAGALYAFAVARSKEVICFALVTNQMARIEGDFEKDEADGTIDALRVIPAAAETRLARDIKPA